MENKDLIWDLDVFNKQQRAQDFVMGFENRLCIFSDSVAQLYTNYNIFFPKDENHKLVILPNPYAHYDTFQGLPAECVKPTGLFILPADETDSGRLNLIIPLGSQKKHHKIVPLEVGLHMINKKRSTDNPFLPVLKKGDLRELNQDTPCLHLHLLRLECLQSNSQLEKDDIQRVITNRIKELARARGKAGAHSGN